LSRGSTWCAVWSGVWWWCGPVGRPRRPVVLPRATSLVDVASFAGRCGSCREVEQAAAQLRLINSEVGGQHPDGGTHQSFPGTAWGSCAPGCRQPARAGVGGHRVGGARPRHDDRYKIHYGVINTQAHRTSRAQHRSTECVPSTVDETTARDIIRCLMWNRIDCRAPRRAHGEDIHATAGPFLTDATLAADRPSRAGGHPYEHPGASSETARQVCHTGGAPSPTSPPGRVGTHTSLVRQMRKPCAGVSVEQVVQRNAQHFTRRGPGYGTPYHQIA
jgi:hypothetical protein